MSKETYYRVKRDLGIHDAFQAFVDVEICRHLKKKKETLASMTRFRPLWMLKSAGTLKKKKETLASMTRFRPLWMLKSAGTVLNFSPSLSSVAYIRVYAYTSPIYAYMHIHRLYTRIYAELEQRRLVHPSKGSALVYAV